MNRPESEIYAEFEALKPSLLGFIFDTLSKVLTTIDSIKLSDLPRLGDFAIWGEAVARVLGYKEREFLEAYYDNIGKQNAESVEADNMGETVVKLCDALVEQKRTKWIGPIRELLNDLKMIAEAINIDTNSKDWPKLSNGLSRRLNEIRTSLLDGFSIEVNIEKLKSDREIEDEIAKDVLGNPVVHKYKRYTLVTIKRLERADKEES